MVTDQTDIDFLQDLTNLTWGAYLVRGITKDYVIDTGKQRSGIYKGHYCKIYYSVADYLNEAIGVLKISWICNQPDSIKRRQGVSLPIKPILVLNRLLGL